MCDPTGGVATGLLMAGSSAVGFAGQQQQASAQQRFQNQRAESVQKAALEAYTSQIGAGQERIAQEARASSDRSLENARSGAAARGTVRASAASRGVAGSTVDELSDDFLRLEAENEAVIRDNLEMTVAQMGRDFQGLQAGAQNRISAAQPQPVFGPSPFALALQMGTAAMAGYNQYLQHQPPLDTKPVATG